MLRAKSNTPTFRMAWQRSFFVTLFFVMLASLLFWLDEFRVYQSEVQILVVGRVSSVATDQVVENFGELAGTLSFYERLLENHQDIEDSFEGYTKDQRKKLWNETVRVAQNKNSGVLSVLAKGDTQTQAKRLSEATVATLFSVASLYYNIETDIDLRVIDESIVETTIGRPVLYGVASFGTALSVTFTFFGLLYFVPMLFGKKRETMPEYPVGASVPFIDPRKFVPTRLNTLSFESTREHQVKQEIKQETVKASVISSTERMLPGMDAEELPFQFEESYPSDMETGETEALLTDLPITNGFVIDQVAAEPAPTVVDIPKGEPTVEEYKRRLNELLAGGK